MGRLRSLLVVLAAFLGFVHGGTSDDGFQVCAAEGDVCTCYGRVTFGTKLKWSRPREVWGAIECSEDMFGNPAAGFQKVCRCWPHDEAECAPLRNPRTGLCLVRDYYDEWLDAWILTMGPCFSNQVVCLKRHPEHNWLTANGLAYCLAPIGLDKMGFNAEKGARVGLIHCPPNDFQGNYGPGLDWNPYRRSQWENGHGLCLTFNDNGRVMQKKCKCPSNRHPDKIKHQEFFFMFAEGPGPAPARMSNPVFSNSGNDAGSVTPAVAWY